MIIRCRCPESVKWIHCRSKDNRHGKWRCKSILTCNFYVDFISIFIKDFSRFSAFFWIDYFKIFCFNCKKLIFLEIIIFSCKKKWWNGKKNQHYTIYLFKKIIFQCISLFYFYLWSKKSSIKNFALEIAQEAQNPILWSATHKINLCDKNYTDEIFITPPIIKTRFFIFYFLHLWNSLLRILKILTAERSRNYYKKHS